MWVKTKKKNIQLRFVDRLRFMASSLSKLAKNLAEVNRMMCDCGSETELMRTTLLMECVVSAEVIAIVS